MAGEFDSLEIDLDNVDEASSNFEPAPIGTHLCRLEVEDLKAFGNNGSLGWKVRGKIVEENNRGKIAEDVLFLSEAAKPRLKLALHRIGGIENGKIYAKDVRPALDGKLARLTVGEIEENEKNGKKYRHAKLTFAGYEMPTSEEIKKYDGEPAAAKTTEKLPF